MVKDIGQLRDRILQLESKLIKKSHREDKCKYILYLVQALLFDYHKLGDKLKTFEDNHENHPEDLD